MNFEKEVLELNLDEIIPNRFQPREKFNEQALNELAGSIKEHGVISPIVVRKIGDKYEIVAGERRYKASLLAGKTTIPAIVANLNDTESAEVALIENVQRRNLTPIEEAKTYKTILNVGNMTQAQLAERIGVNQSTVANKLRLLDLDDTVQDALLNDKISERHARSLLTLPSKEDQKEFLDKIIDNRMTVRETDLAIKEKLGTNQPVNNVSQDIEIISDEDESNGTNGANTIPLASIKPIENTSVDNFDDNSIEKIKEQASDINIEQPIPNLNNLLKSEGEDDGGNVVKPITPQPINPIPNNDENNFKFFAPIEEEPMAPTPLNDIQNLDAIKTFDNVPTDNVVEDRPINPEPTPISANIPTSNSFANVGGNQTYVTGDLRTAINAVRQCVDTIEKYGFTVDSEEFDFENMYQIIIKIDKK